MFSHVLLQSWNKVSGPYTFSHVLLQSWNEASGPYMFSHALLQSRNGRPYAAQNRCHTFAGSRIKSFSGWCGGGSRAKPATGWLVGGGAYDNLTYMIVSYVVNRKLR